MADVSVSDTINAAQEHANDAFEEASALISNAQNHAQTSYGFAPPTEMTWEPEELDPELVAVPTLPDPFAHTYNEVLDALDIPSIPELLNLELPAVPFTEFEPLTPFDSSNLFDYQQPDTKLGEFQEQEPNIDTNIRVDDPPRLEYPDAPTVSTPDIDDPPGITIPPFTATLDATLPDVPDDLASTFEAKYESMAPEMRAAIEDIYDGWIAKYSPEYHTAMAKIEALLAEGLEGGTALSDTVEQAIYDRARARVQAEYNRVENTVATAAAKRGLFMPSGALLSGLRTAQQDAANNISQSANELAIKRAEIELSHLQFLMQLSSGIRDSLRNTAVQYAALFLEIDKVVLDYAKTVTNLMADLFNLALSRFEAAARVYAIEAQVYETELKAAFAALEEYKALLEAEKLRTEVDDMRVRLYSARITAETQKIDAYVAKLKGLDSKVNAERLKVELFGEQVKAYAARADALRARVGVYEAAMRGDSERVRARAIEVDAKNAETNYLAEQVKYNELLLRKQEMYNRDVLQRYEAQLRQVGIETDLKSKEFQGNAAQYAALLTAYRAQLDHDSTQLQAELQNRQFEVNFELTRYKSEMETKIQEAMNRREQVRVRADTAIAGANTMGSLAASALSANNTMVSLVEEAISGAA